MSTWSELRQEILFKLGASVSATTNDDTRIVVDLTMKRKRDEIYGICPPRSLLVHAGPVSVPSTLEYIKIYGATGGATQPSFAITDFGQSYSLVMSESTETNFLNAEDWEPIEWDSWIRQNSSVQGNQRLSCTYAQDYRDFLYLRSLPTTGTTWNAWLHYYKTAATISDGGTPEIGAEHECLLVSGVCLEFPQLFRGEERASIYAQMASMYAKRLAAYGRAMASAKRAMRLRPFKKRSASSTVFWGTGETS